MPKLFSQLGRRAPTSASAPGARDRLGPRATLGPRAIVTWTDDEKQREAERGRVRDVRREAEDRAA